MDRFYRYPSRDLPQVYWHLRDCAARFGCELRRQTGAPDPGAPRGATFDLVTRASAERVGEVRVVENQFGALITLADLREDPAALAGLFELYFECMALPPERRARRWPRST